MRHSYRRAIGIPFSIVFKVFNEYFSRLRQSGRGAERPIGFGFTFCTCSTTAALPPGELYTPCCALEVGAGRLAGSLGLGLFPRWAMVERARAEAEVRRCRVVKENIPAAPLPPLAPHPSGVRRPPAPGRPNSPHVTGGGGGRSDFSEHFVQRDPVVGSHIPPS